MSKQYQNQKKKWVEQGKKEMLDKFEAILSQLIKDGRLTESTKLYILMQLKEMKNETFRNR